VSVRTHEDGTPAVATSWERIEVPEQVRVSHEAAGGGHLSAWERGSVRVIRAVEPLGPGGKMAWHLSISCPDRYPEWDELADARYDLLPHDRSFCMILPPPSDYVNAHNFVFHLHEHVGS
jgi:hypothetical protein